MRSWSPSHTINGWYPAISPDGLKVTYGAGECHVTDFRTDPPRELQLVVPEGRAWHGFWLSDYVLTFFSEVPNNLWQRYEVRVPDDPNGPWVPTRIERLQAAFFSGRNGHWGASMPWGTYFYDGEPYALAQGGHGIQVAGHYLAQLHTEGFDIQRFHVPTNAVMRVRAMGPDFTLNKDGWIGSGYFGPAYVVDPSGRVFDVTATPWRAESTPRVVMADGIPWVWNGSLDPASGDPFAIGRPLLDVDYWDVPVKVVPLLATASFDVQYLSDQQEFMLAGTDAKGRLSIIHTDRQEGFIRLTPRLPPFTRPLAFGTFFSFSNPIGSGLPHPYGSTPDYPQNVTVVVNPEVVGDAAARVPIIVPATEPMLAAIQEKQLQSRVWALYIASEEEGGGALVAEQMAVAAKKAWLRRFQTDTTPPVLWYVTPREAERLDWTIPPSVDLFGPQFYFEDYSANQTRMGELLWRMAGRWMDKLGTSKPWVLICQAFNRSRAEVDMEALAAMQPAFLTQLLTIDPRIGKLLPAIGLLFFAVNRPGGTKDYPKLAAWHQAMFKSLPVGNLPSLPVPTSRPPKATILDYTPSSGKVPLKVRAVAKIEEGSGPATEWIWLWRMLGDSKWIASARNSSDDLDHTYVFSAAGLYEIALEAVGPGGTARTQRPRIITAEKESEIPVPPPSEVKYAAIRTVNGFYWCAENEGKDPLNATRTEVGDWERFALVNAGDGKLGFRSKVTGLYLAVEPNSPLVLCNRPDSVNLGPWETFEMVPMGNNGFAFRAHTGKFINAAFGGGGVVRADKDKAFADETFFIEGNILVPGAGAHLDGIIGVHGRTFMTDSGVFRPRFTSALSILRRSDVEQREFLAWAASTGFNGIRVFAGALTWAGQSAAMAVDRLPGLLDTAAEFGLYVEVTALTDTKDGRYDFEDHLRRLEQIISRRANVIVEIANEPYHPTQIDELHDPGFVRSLQRTSLFGCPVALGAAADDESKDFAGGNFVTAHLDRGRDKWNMVRRVRELEVLSAATGKPVLNNEPIGAAEVAIGGKRESDPAVFFTMGVLNRLFEVGGVHHSQHGLDAVMPGPVQQACAEAFVRGSNALGNGQMTFKNAGWPDSPIAGAAFDSGVVRAYSGLSDEKNVVVLVGVTGDPAVRTQNGWRLGGVLDEMPGVQVVELIR